jgi:hypothetical protein
LTPQRRLTLRELDARLLATRPDTASPGISTRYPPIWTLSAAERRRPADAHNRIICGDDLLRIPAVDGGARWRPWVPSTSLVPVQLVFSDAGRLASVGFLSGYRGMAREAYTLDQRQFNGWCRARSVPLFSARRADIESFAPAWKPRAEPASRLCTIAWFYT